MVEGLLSLPEELWHQIAQHISSNDAVALSFVCKSLHLVAHTLTPPQPTHIRISRHFHLHTWRLADVKEHWKNLRVFADCKEIDFSDPDTAPLLSTLATTHALSLTLCTDIPDVATLVDVCDLSLADSSGSGDLALLGGCRSLNLDGWTNDVVDASPFRRCVSVSLHGARISEVESLASARHLNLTRCDRVTDFSALRNAHTLNLSHTRVTDVSALAHVHDLNLSHCTELSIVTSLTHVPTLNLSFCVNMADFSPLTNNRTLTLDHTHIADVSHLGAVHTLSLQHCTAINKGLDALGRVHFLDLTGCGISDVSGLSGVHTLVLAFNHAVDDVSSLDSVHSLDLTHCGKVNGLNSLTALHTVRLFHVDVSDFAPLRNVNSLNLAWNSHITDSDLDTLSGVSTLDLSYCKQICDVSALTSVRVLVLRDCKNIRDVSSLRSLHTLNISGCSYVDDVSMLGSLHHLDISNCRSIRSVEGLGLLHTLLMSNCVMVKDVSEVGSVHTLDIRGCRGLRDISMLTGVVDLRADKAIGKRRRRNQ